MRSILLFLLLFALVFPVFSQQAPRKVVAPLADTLPPVHKSLFNRKNAGNCFFFIAEPVEWSAYFFDSSRKFRSFLRRMEKYAGIHLQQDTGLAADSAYLGTRLYCRETVRGILWDWRQPDTIPVSFSQWHIIDPAKDDCRSGPVQPYVRLNAPGIEMNFSSHWLPGIICFGNKLKFAPVKPVVLRHISCDEKNWASETAVLDVDSDGISDLLAVKIYDGRFSQQEIYRVYVNVSGRWQLRWSAITEVCTD